MVRVLLMRSAAGRWRWLLAAVGWLWLGACVDIPGAFHPTPRDGDETGAEDAAAADGADGAVEVIDAVADTDAEDGAVSGDGAMADDGEGPAETGGMVTALSQVATPSVVVGTSSSGGLVLRALEPLPAVVRGTSEAGSLRLRAGP